MAEILLIALASLSGAILLLMAGDAIYKRYVVEGMKKDLQSNKASILETYKYGSKNRFKNIQIASDIKKKLKKAGWSISEYLFLFLVCFLSFLFAGVFYLLIDNIISVAMGAFIGGYAPFFALSIATHRRRREFNTALSAGISMLVRMMRNGIGFEQALKKSVDANESVVFRDVLGRFLREKEIVGEEKAFAAIYELVDSAELQIFGISVVIGRSSGGKFSNTLEKLEESINSRIKLQRKVDVATSEASFGSYLIVAILIIIFWMMDVSFEGKMSEYFFDTESGKLQFMMTVSWVALGLFLNSILTRVK